MCNNLIQYKFNKNHKIQLAIVVPRKVLKLKTFSILTIILVI